MNVQQLLTPIYHFLPCRTPQAWIDEAVKPQHLALLLSDHLACELKAAQTAAWLIRRYIADKQSGEALLAWLKPYEDRVYHGSTDLQGLAAQNMLPKGIISRSGLPATDSLAEKMLCLIREELHHFRQVLEIMQVRQLRPLRITASRYASGLMRQVATYEPWTRVDKLICGAYIEARSCERFASIAPFLDDPLQKFYLSLLRSEARHYQHYLQLAREMAPADITRRIRRIGEAERQLIQQPDSELRFHSGVPGG